MVNNAPSVYNGPSVYKSAGGKQNILFYTDFSKYDTVDNIDYPLIGDEIQFNTNSTLTKNDNYLSIKGISGNTYVGTKIFIETKIRFAFAVSFSNPDININSFIWLVDKFGIAFDNNSDLFIIIDTSFNVVLYNTSYTKTAAGYNWYRIGYSQENKFEFIDIQFYNGDAIIFYNGVKILSFGILSIDNFFITYDPRGNGTINAFNVLSY